jgi:hypothetical protein
VGLYDLADGGKRAPVLKPAGQDHVILGDIQVN